MNFFLSSNLAIAFIAGGCAHYTVAPTYGKTIAVETVAVPADVDVDGGALTNALVAHLNERGFETTWSKNGDIVCDLSVLGNHGFASASAPTAKITCEVGKEIVNATGATHASVGLEYNVETRGNVVTNAALEAVKNVSPKIERILRENKNGER